MNAPVGEHQILPFELSWALGCLAAAVAVAAWAGLHMLKRRAASRPSRALLFALRLGVGFVAILCVLDLMQRVVVLATNWPIWPIALGGAAVVEVLLLLYALERRIVPRGTSIALAALRVAIALLVVGMLTQPVRSVEWGKDIQRVVAVLVDRSASMRVPDNQMTAAEKTRLAEVLSPEAPRRTHRLEAVAKHLTEARRALSPQIDWLASLAEMAPESRLKQLEKARKARRTALEALAKTLDEQAKALAAPLEGDLELPAHTRAALASAVARLDQDVRAPLAEALELLDADSLPSLADDCTALRDPLRRAAAALGKLEPQIVDLGEALDQAFYAALSDEERQEVDSIALRNRLAVARSLLYDPLTEPATGKTTPGLLDTLRRRYGVKLYSFASKPVEVALDAGLPAEPADGDERTKEEQTTDIAAALEKVISEVPADRLAGVIILTDGRHNAPGTRVERLARRVGIQRVPVSSVVFGAGAKPTTDAAIVSLGAPETIYKKDKMYLDAELKLDGLAGKLVKVALYDGDKPVDMEEIDVETDKLRTRIQLADEPKEAGLHHYRVRIETLDGEVLTTNNERPLSVSVSDEQTSLLYVEGRPRWEFRYLKNIFASRDRTVRLQYVLLHPDIIDPTKRRRKVYASAAPPQPEPGVDAPPRREPEATAVPQDEAEWLKFDVIVLGDVDPADLAPEHLAAIEKFVQKRAGTLIVVAGPHHMPHAYPADSPLADLLPVTFEPLDELPDSLPSPDRTFRVALTPEGRQSIIPRLKVDPDDNLETWKSLPQVHWRHPLLVAKEGATVLAYALPPSPPDFLEARPRGEKPDAKAIAERRQFIRDHALIALHHMARGRVLCLTFDRTWRLRYRVGDTHHHKFWGQILRWATQDKLSAGTEHVKVGTDRPRYPPRTKIVAKAKVTTPELAALPLDRRDKVWANVVDTRDDRMVLRKKMAFVPDSLGMYRADLGTLPGGTYRLELSVPPDPKRPTPRLPAPKAAKPVATQFFVADENPVEEVELAADRGLLERVATLTHGVVVDPPRAIETLAALREPTITHRDAQQWPLWDSWPLLVLIVILAGTEWLLRKRARLP